MIDACWLLTTDHVLALLQQKAVIHIEGADDQSAGLRLSSASQGHASQALQSTWLPRLHACTRLHFPSRFKAEDHLTALAILSDQEFVQAFQAEDTPPPG
ncbi:hypothetical protein WJX82_004851 [Trebouxia sp. C0006]